MWALKELMAAVHRKTKLSPSLILHGAQYEGDSHLWNKVKIAEFVARISNVCNYPGYKHADACSYTFAVHLMALKRRKKERQTAHDQSTLKKWHRGFGPANANCATLPLSTNSIY